MKKIKMLSIIVLAVLLILFHYEKEAKAQWGQCIDITSEQYYCYRVDTYGGIECIDDYTVAGYYSGPGRKAVNSAFTSCCGEPIYTNLVYDAQCAESGGPCRWAGQSCNVDGDCCYHSSSVCDQTSHTCT